MRRSIPLSLELVATLDSSMAVGGENRYTSQGLKGMHPLKGAMVSTLYPGTAMAAVASNCRAVPPWTGDRSMTANNISGKRMSSKTALPWTILEIDESPSLADILTILGILVDQIFGVRNRRQQPRQ